MKTIQFNSTSAPRSVFGGAPFLALSALSTHIEECQALDTLVESIAAECDLTPADRLLALVERIGNSL